jgi:aminoglycoside phosphotransferase family enzyme
MGGFARPAGPNRPRAALIAGLLDPAAYPHPAARVRLIETHISYVFLAGRYAYKIKKAVNFGFLDYSTLERRRHFCHEEVRLNQRLCADTYLGAVPIVAGSSGVRVGGEGKPLEYAVAMRRLPARRMLDGLVRRGRASEEMIERVARRVADFHAGASRGPEIDRFVAFVARQHQVDHEVRHVARGEVLACQGDSFTVQSHVTWLVRLRPLFAGLC